MALGVHLPLEIGEGADDGGHSLCRAGLLEGMAEPGDGAAMAVARKPVESGLGVTAETQVFIDAALDGGSAESEGLFAKTAVTGAVGPEAEIGNFVGMAVMEHMKNIAKVWVVGEEAVFLSGRVPTGSGSRRGGPEPRRVSARAGDDPSRRKQD
jgi:hypothetical protein